MKFLVHAAVNSSRISEQLGAADYSYFFLLRSFSAVLADLGEVICLDDPAEADIIHARCEAAGEPCLLLSFAPPHKTPMGLVCPVVPVFAWEYPDIPERIEEASWRDDARNDWRHVLAYTERAITLSNHTVEAVRRSMGGCYPIVAIPAPIPRAPVRASMGRQVPPADGTMLEMFASIADSLNAGLDVNGLICLDEEDGTSFHPSDMEHLPEIDPSNDVAKVEAKASDRSSDPDELPVPGFCWDPPSPVSIRTRLRGVVYTSVLTPSAGRKNWEDLITAFCWAFRDNADATLILKLAGSDLTRRHHEMMMMLTKMSPLKCRIIAIHGYLADADYAALVESTSFYVNASLCEGLCLPLVEFLNCGVPAIAPDNTAMSDYMRDDIGFVVDSYPGVPTVWPHGDKEINRTSYHQLDWQSLFDAYRSSYALAMHNPSRYEEMSLRATAAMQDYAGQHRIKAALRRFLCPDQMTAQMHADNPACAIVEPALS